jgi:excisionase family DNA binding protein
VAYQTGSRKLLRIPEAAERLGLKPASVRFWVWTRKIEHAKIGRSVRIPEHVIERLIELGTIPAERR